MSSKNLINSTIKKDFKTEEKVQINNEIKNKNIDNSFNQLLSLQLIVQKHSGLKELCKNY